MSPNRLQQMHFNEQQVCVCVFCLFCGLSCTMAAAHIPAQLSMANTTMNTSRFTQADVTELAEAVNRGTLQQCQDIVLKCGKEIITTPREAPVRQNRSFGSRGFRFQWYLFFRSFPTTHQPGNSALHDAAYYHKFEILQWFLQHDIDCNVRGYVSFIPFFSEIPRTSHWISWVIVPSRCCS